MHEKTGKNSWVTCVADRPAGEVHRPADRDLACCTAQAPGINHEVAVRDARLEVQLNEARGSRTQRPDRRQGNAAVLLAALARPFFLQCRNAICTYFGSELRRGNPEHA